ncbi:nicotinate-nucleotide adenylyltransferase [Acetivibrio thermocellus]|uniref:nicotinate-nucleotide adenylyltransferase n=1 Tax=Acetivibrio thermocellus TaxID=1515 RepID=UPI0010A635D2|nr:nicotinate-nucleotide adenylyltransferase [Acetivibrio thermocellus]THJ79016.1 nicotinate-nucleotide adenylyltransferase [Acetivibrio thermocellus]
MEVNVKRIGILGGTFDPIHNGHLIMAEIIRGAFELDKVLFIPSGNPPHKKNQTVTDAEHRYNMVCEALKGNPYFEKSRIEVDREGYTYTIDTLAILNEQYKGIADLYYIIGADVLYDLLTWKDCEKVFGICKFIAALRPGTGKEGFRERIKYLEDRFSASILEAEIPLIEISSTMIRNRVKEGKSIKYLVPETVENYIKKEGLYLK